MKSKKTEFGADKEADEILSKLPRSGSDGFEAGKYPRATTNAWIYIDAAGRLNILPVSGGWLGINERDLAYLHGDFDPFGVDIQEP